jgi:phage terminase large subunit-like protein
MNWIKIYQRQLKDAPATASKRLKRVFERLVEKIENPKGDYHFDEKAANKPIEFIETFCKQSKGEWIGKPLRLELFQKAFISALFGFIDKNGNRQYHEAFFYVARKNGKSTMLAGLALYCLIADGEGGAEIYSIATKKDQARLIFDEACNMVVQSEILQNALKKRKTDLYYPKTFSKFKPLGKNADTLDGVNCHFCVLDEAHQVKGRGLYEVLKQSQSARQQPLFLTTTTAGTLRESIFDDLYSYACKVADGEIEDEKFLPILYELDDKTEWQNPEMWIKANPALGTIKKVEDLKSKVKRAAQSPKELTGLLTKDFNVICNTNSAWLLFDEIKNDATFDLSQFKGKYGIGGVDLSMARDLTCATLLMIDAQEIKYCVQMYWLPEDGFYKRVEEEKIPYDKWQEKGLLRLCKGNVIDYSDVTEWFTEMVEKYEIIPFGIYFDPFSARYWTKEMEQRGYRMIKVYQQHKYLSLPMQMLGADLQAKKLNYNNNPILKWCLSNTGVEEDKDGNIKPIKANRQKDRIDGTASLINAYFGLFRNYQEFLNLA